MLHFRAFCAKLEKLHSNVEIIQECEKAGLQCLSVGSSRVVYALNDRHVIKIARNKAGQCQNMCEHQIWMYLDYDVPHYKQYFAKVHVELTATNEMFIVMDRLQKVTKGVRKYPTTIFGYGRGFKLKIDYSGRPGRMAKAVKHIDETFDSLIAEDCTGYQLGQDRNGLIKILDYGLDQACFNKFYRVNRRQKQETLFM